MDKAQADVKSKHWIKAQVRATDQVAKAMFKAQESAVQTWLLNA